MALQAVGCDGNNATLATLNELTSGLEAAIAALKAEAAKSIKGGVMGEAKHACNVILPAMLEVRSYVDQLEDIIADDLWPLPTYQEMLFIK